MDALDWSGLIALGFAAGMAGGLVGVGGGVLFVPALVVFAHESQLGAEATSLVAIVLVSVVGTVRQRSYGNLRLKDGLLIGALSPLGVLVGVVLANLLSARVLELAFAAMQLVFAWQLAKKAGLR
ncbi:MAG: TSUP family transporter [Thermoleophilaceae bacterium]